MLVDAPDRSQPVRLRREKRRGRPVIVVHDFPDDVDVAALGKELRQHCGTGGTTKAGTIEIQGDHRERIEAFLRERGFTTKRSGG